MKRAELSEIFFSLQGEGPYIGIPQVFLRFAGCNLSCCFCDTRQTLVKTYTVTSLWQAVETLLKKHNARVISLTGGEPLLQVDFLQDFLRRIKDRKPFVYLETNGILYENFGRIRNYVDIVAMDIKLPSAAAAGEFWAEHERFLKSCSGKEVFVKAIITMATKEADVKKAVYLISKTDKNVLLVLQPDYFELGVRLVRKMLNFQKMAAGYLRNVRIIPQVHKLMGVK